MKLISVKEYAVREQITVQAVYKRIKSEKIKSKKIGSMVFVRE